MPSRCAASSASPKPASSSPDALQARHGRRRRSASNARAADRPPMPWTDPPGCTDAVTYGPCGAGEGPAPSPGSMKKAAAGPDAHWAPSPCHVIGSSTIRLTATPASGKTQSCWWQLAPVVVVGLSVTSCRTVTPGFALSGQRLPENATSAAALS